MNFDALSALRRSGHPVDLLSPAQQAVLAELTEDQVQFLDSVKERLDHAAPAAEVEGMSSELKLL